MRSVDYRSILICFDFLISVNWDYCCSIFGYCVEEGQWLYEDG